MGPTILAKIIMFVLTLGNVFDKPQPKHPAPVVQPADEEDDQEEEEVTPALHIPDNELVEREPRGD